MNLVSTYIEQWLKRPPFKNGSIIEEINRFSYMRLSNGSEIITPRDHEFDNVRGRTADLIIIDDFSFMR